MYLEGIEEALKCYIKLYVPQFRELCFFATASM